ncbi:MAG: DUF3800 domain-containing protein [Kiritimatiellales bacterium]|nr:DUF3800 domain-containing protein [Kiritimatiellales bacterium]
MSIAASSKYIAFFDECGDHSLEKIDADFPLFILSTVIIERSAYVEVVVPELTRLKLRFWPHEGVNLHSRDIRKEHGDFSFMRVPDQRKAMLTALSELMAALPFTLFITAIRKAKHKERYGQNADNPYDVALTYTFERVLHFLEGVGEISLPVTAEARGKNEDNQLEASFLRIVTEGTRYNSPERFCALHCPLMFRRKSDNIAGMQLADLCAYPAARKVLKPDQPNQAYEVIAPQIYRRDAVSGWKVFP